MKKVILLFTTVLFSFQLNAQYSSRVLIPTYGFLTIAPDARHGGMGDAGVATPSDESDFYWNPSKSAFSKKRFSLFSVPYRPWLPKLVSDMYLGYLGASYKVDDRNAISASITYFNLGLFQVTNNNGIALGNVNSKEWSVSFNYAKKLSSKLSMGVGFRYIKSSLFEGLNTNTLGFEAKPAQNLAADISLYHHDIDETELFNFDYGIYLSNIGSKVSYGSVEEGFMPTNLRIGLSPNIKLGAKHKIIGAVDLNKLLIPTPPEKDNNGKIIRGRDMKNLSAFEGMIGSFTDAPDGFSEELKEISLSTGAEYWYDDTYAARIGLLSNSKEKGLSSFFTFGAGVRIVKIVGIDLAYMINSDSNSILGNLWRANINVSFGKIKTQNEQK